MPPACVESAVSTCVSDPTASLATVPEPVPTSRSPLAVMSPERSTSCQVEPLSLNSCPVSVS